MIYITANVEQSADSKFITKQNTKTNSPTFLHLNKTVVNEGKPPNENCKTNKIANININTSVASPNKAAVAKGKNSSRFLSSTGTLYNLLLPPPSHPLLP
jgi:hypothetical protein